LDWILLSKEFSNATRWKNDRLIVLDYKTRGFPLKEDTAAHYQDQLDIYNFLLRKNGYRTEDYGYLLFYLAAGVAAGTLHVIANPNSPAPTIGASGAVAGVLGAYVVMFPGARILTLVPLFVFSLLMMFTQAFNPFLYFQF
jgi:xanthosine utilization system XapX-like protein